MANDEINLSAIAANAIENAEWWLDSAFVKAYNSGEKADPAMISGFMVAAGLSYQADRQALAAEIIAGAIRDVAKGLASNGNGGGNG